ncbi:MAG: SLOG family protein [Phormidium sp.]
MLAAFTGHRYIEDFTTQWYKGMNNLIDLALEQKTTEFLVGMALGADQLFAKLLINRKLKWTAVIPCADQTELWKRSQQRQYNQLLAQATKKIVLYPKYSKGVMQARNLWMIKRSNLCLAVYDGRNDGGTKLTVDMAIAHNRTVVQFHPFTYQLQLIEPAEQLSLF